MGFLFFVAAIILAILLSQKSSQAKSVVDPTSASYRQGYWDGVRAAEQGAAHSPEVSSVAVLPVMSESTEKIAVVGESDNSTPIDELAPVTSFRDKSVPVKDHAVPAPVQPPPLVGYVAPPPHSSTPSPQSSSHITINIALYVAVLLLVSGIILLAQTFAFESWLRMALVWLLIIVSYIAGFMLQKHIPMIRPATLALVGTALASIPVAGVTMYALVLHDAALCWFITSFIGVVMYVLAAITFKNQFLSYISILSLFTASMSLPAMVDAQLAWYYVIMIAFGGAMTLLSCVKVPSALKLFAQPMYTSSLVAVPLALLAATTSVAVLSVSEYTVVFVAGLLYYTAQALTTSNKSVRNYAEFSARLLTLVATGTAAAWASDTSYIAISLSVAFVALLNIIASLHYLPVGTVRASIHEAMLWIGFFTAALVAPFLASIPSLLKSDAALAHPEAMPQLVELALAMMLSLFTAARLRRYGLLWPALYIITVPLLIVVNNIVHISYDTYITIYMACIVLILALRLLVRRLTLSAGTLVYASVSIWLLFAVFYIAMYAFTLGHDVSWWHISWWTLLAVVFYYVVVVEKLRWVVLCAHGATLAAGWLLCAKCSFNAAQTVVTLGVGHSATTIALAEYFRWRNRISRTAAMYRYAAVGYGAAIGLAVLITSMANEWRMLAWLPIVAIGTHAAYRQKEIVMMYALHTVLVVQILLAGIACNLSYVEICALAAWLPFVGFGAVSVLMRAANRATAKTKTWWRSGVACALTFGSFALLSNQTYLMRSAGWLAAVAAMYVLVYVVRRAALLYAGNVMSVILVALLCAWCGVSFSGALVAIAAFGLIGFYGVGWLYRLWRGAGRVWNAMLVSSLTVACSAGLLASLSSDVAIVAGAAVILVGAGAVFSVQSYEMKRLEFAECGVVIAMLGAQRLLCIAFPDTHALVYTHLWVLVAAALYAGYHICKRPIESICHLVILLCLVTIPGLAAAFIDGGWYQLLFLVEHTAVVIVGVVTARKLTSIWGAVGVTVAILYMLREFQALLNIMIGLLVLAAVVFAIVRANRKNVRIRK